MKKDSKQRLFEVMQRVAPNFTGKALNEEVGETPKSLQDKIMSAWNSMNTQNTDSDDDITDDIFARLKNEPENTDNKLFWRTIYNHVRHINNLEKQSGDYVSAGRNVNAPEDTGVGERPNFNQHGEYMGLSESKKKLFEMVSKIDPIFKPKLNEDLNNMNTEQEPGIKFRAEVTGKGENVWSTNAKEFNTPEEAKEWLDNLSSRWFGYDMGRVVPTTTPKGQPVDLANDDIYQNFRKK